MELEKKDLERIRLTRKKSTKSFYFGESVFHAKETLEIPVKLGGEKIYIRTEHLDGDIPWLMGKETMERMKLKLDVNGKKAVLGALGNKEVS